MGIYNTEKGLIYQKDPHLDKVEIAGSNHPVGYIKPPNCTARGALCTESMMLAKTKFIYFLVKI
ncbi:hypothetical protein CN471_24790 [Bacillus thuringiensis]|nr:hypothetical protein CN471_24790 [Bacillus thuringiensis]